MDKIIEIANKIGLPTAVIICISVLYIITGVVGSILDVKGKVAPEIINWRRYRRRKREEKERQKILLENVLASLDEMKCHYSPEKIAERDAWITCVNENMSWVHKRADEYDASIEKIVSALDANTKMTEDMFVESSRDRIIDFAEKASNYDCILSREQFRRIDRVYNDYETFLEDRGRQNGEVDTAYELIQDGYKHRLKCHAFVEDMRMQQKTTEQND